MALESSNYKVSFMEKIDVSSNREATLISQISLQS